MKVGEKLKSSSRRNQIALHCWSFLSSMAIKKLRSCLGNKLLARSLESCDARGKRRVGGGYALGLREAKAIGLTVPQPLLSRA